MASNSWLCRYNKVEIPRVPVIVTGNDFSTLYAPLIRDGRMEKFYWAPTREDRIGVCQGIFREDKIGADEVTRLVDTFPGQSIGKTQPSRRPLDTSIS